MGQKTSKHLLPAFSAVFAFAGLALLLLIGNPIAQTVTPIEGPVIDINFAHVDWTPETLVVAISPGETKTIDVKLKSSGNLPSTLPQIAPALQPFLTILPSTIPSFSGISEQTIQITISIPEGLEFQDLEGTLHLRRAKLTVAKSLPISLSIWSRESDSNLTVFNSTRTLWGHNEGNSITLWWERADQGDHYSIFRSSSPSGPWEYLGDSPLDRPKSVDLTPESNLRDLYYRIEVRGATGDLIETYPVLRIPQFISTEEPPTQQFSENSFQPTESPDQINVGPSPYNTMCISDPDLTAGSAMTESQVQQFLSTRKSFMRAEIADVDGALINCSQLIHMASLTHDINPKVLLATIEKESGGIRSQTRPNAPLTLRYLMGWDPNDVVIPRDQKSMRQQIDACAAQLRRDFDRLTQGQPTGPPGADGWRVGVDHLSCDHVLDPTISPITVRPATKTVAVLFAYTCEVGVEWGGSRGHGGNALFCALWQRFGFVSGPPASLVFEFTGGPQPWLVPDNVTSITVDARGAEGGGTGTGDPNNENVGGKGGRIQTTLVVTPGETLVIYVGGRGGQIGSPNTPGQGGFNGGGRGGVDNCDFNGPAYGGGGASDVRQRGATTAHRVVVAGGGGGAECCTPGSVGGDGGGVTGLSGSCSGSECSCAAGGGGATLLAGGAGGSGCGGCNTGGSNGILGQGGQGGNGNRSGGGGGGGYFGGGGGGGCCLGAGGGGGSSYSAGANTLHFQGAQIGDGLVIITPLSPSECAAIVFETGNTMAPETVDKLILSESKDQLPVMSGATNYPNPFNANTVVSYTLAEPGRVQIEIFNVLGQSVGILVDEVQAPGTHSMNWDGKDDRGMPLASGVYFYRLSTSNSSQVKKMVIVK